MRFQRIELCALALLLAAAASARPESFADAIASEAKRLSELVPGEERTGIAEKEIALALDRLQTVETALASGRSRLALYRLSGAQETMESAAYLREHLATGRDPVEFTALWEAEGKKLEREHAELAGAGFDGKSALVRAYGEIAVDRILPNHSAARLYAKAGAEGGLFYLGSALAASRFASFCARLPDEPEGSRPKFKGLAEKEAELSKQALAAYGEGDASTAHHRDFIRLDSALKEARKLLADGYRFGAAASLVEVRLRLGVIARSGSASPDPEAAAYRSRLFDPSTDHSIALSLWERAIDLSASSNEPDRTEAAVILEEVLPFYFEILEE